jgi:ribosome-associated heat shock protein Hsp15
VLRRKVAQELCELGAVTVNGAPARPARTVRIGDEITLRRGERRRLVVRVTQMPALRQTAKSEAAQLYEIVAEENVEGAAD